LYKNLDRICGAFMDDNKRHRLRQRLLLIVVPFLLGFGGIVVLEIFLVQNGKMPWFVVRKAEQQYLFRTSGALVQYFIVQGKKNITREEVEAIKESMHKQFPELSGTFNKIPIFAFFRTEDRNGTKGVLVVGRLSTANTNDGISYETASRAVAGVCEAAGIKRPGRRISQ